MNGRELAYIALMQFDATSEQISSILETKLHKYKLSDKERKFSFNLVNGVLRHRNLLDWKISEFYKGTYAKALNKLKNILRLAMYEFDFLSYIPPHATVNEYVNLTKRKLPRGRTPLVNAILRNYLRDGKNLNPKKKFKYKETQLSVEYSIPEWLIKRWFGFWGIAETEKICASFSLRPEFDIHIDPRYMDVDNFEEILSQNSIKFKRSIYFENTFKMTDIQALNRLGLFQKGICRVQDESNRFVVELLNPGENDIILDTCASPGGKFISIDQHTGGASLIIGTDIFRDRLEILKQNLTTWRINPLRILQSDSMRPPFKKVFTKILLDVPCTGLGTLQKNPDIKWRRTIDEIIAFQKMQLSLLTEASKLLVEGGLIVYSTCTIDPSENEEVIGEFLKARGNEFKIIPPSEERFRSIRDGDFMRTFPHKHQMDGAFAAKIMKL